MDKKEFAAEVVGRLKAAYPIAECTLDSHNAWQLLFNARLAAQCTDKRVNEVTPALYEKYPTLEAFADADISCIEELIKSTGFFRVKSKDLKACAQMLLAEFGGEVPHTLDELLRLPGVGRKVANLILGDIFHQPGAVVADTHCIRLSNRIGLADSKDPKKVEFALRDCVAPSETNDFCHRLVLHGRAVCNAQHPRCEVCVLRDLCRNLSTPIQPENRD